MMVIIDLTCISTAHHGVRCEDRPPGGAVSQCPESASWAGNRRQTELNTNIELEVK